jgi:hypothetical protein
MLKFISIFSIFLIIFSGCSYSSFEYKENIIIGRITQEVADQMKREHGMHLIGGGGGEDHGLCMLGLSFVIYRPIEKDETRQLIVKTAEIFLEKINSSQDLRPFLRDYPFTTKNIQIFYSSYKSEKLDLTFDPYITGGYLDENGITYLTNDPKDENHFNNRYIEPYEEALKIVQIKKTNL